MKKLFITLLVCVIGLGVKGQVSPQAFQQWHGDKFSMFIHFGLYSQLGGVWNHQQIQDGYSEQIRAFAQIPQEEYEKLASEFNPTAFNADSIALLAKKAGMHSIIFTSKHHDGFCLFKTATTPFNSYDASPCKRDFVKELAEAAHRQGLRFGLYFSLIDWHYPYASPMSPHNADFITEAHHNYTKQQLKELLTRYGTISELWFDMGSNTPAQSKELYEMVHQYQPDCMVSGRLGNDQYNFCVMADNDYPEKTLHAPWQSAASMFNETWGYRSWQERGKVEDKVREKILSLINVVSRGGNYLLNIGPKGNGEVVDFEKEVLEQMGNWLSRYGYAVYQTEASPFQQEFEWGAVTRKDNHLYLFLSGNYPKEGKITFQMPGYILQKGDGKMATYLQYGDEVVLTIPASAYKDKQIHVLTLDFDKKIEPLPGNTVRSIVLTAQNATPQYSYSCFDYYTNYRSVIGYSWNFEQLLLKQLEVVYTSQEAGREIDLTLDGKTYHVTLNKGKEQKINSLSSPTWGETYVCGPGNGIFHAKDSLSANLQHSPLTGKAWKQTKEEGTLDCPQFASYYILREIEAPRSQYVLAEVGAGNGMEIYVNGKLIAKHLNPYRTKFRTEKVLLPLEKGKNMVILRSYNRFETQATYLLRPAEEQKVYRQDVVLPDALNGKDHSLVLKPHNPSSPHTDAELSNLRIRLRRIALNKGQKDQ
ncbi:alpha-L-fucosidase [Bacteroides mediterraneensis]|uniref:alpha-L-fucosidase n=1 Tax=Bacteroides mediterraneensis TaxID=1841856 RepID=A0ABS2EXV6_9BACE|nr:alpha-L-fucosidase [Bacteroides mediterraneensis]MBM6759143.1 alpha-L-fucosidase [Bacteroides mediterraneensis]MBM6781074.1 alpha-L-fucosidase [Bacteroides mediterraneensis]